MIAQRGGQNRSQGRKPLAEGQPSVGVTIRMTAAQREKLKRLGGAKWVRARIDKALTPSKSERIKPVEG